MNMCDFGQNTNESLTLRKEFISDQKNEYITCRTLLHRVYIKKKSLELKLSYTYIITFNFF